MSDVRVFKRVSKPKKKENLFLRLPEKKDIVLSCLLFLSARASVLELSPFCTAMFGAIYDKRIGYLGMAVSVLGLLLRNTAQGADIVKYIFAMTGFWLFSKVKEDYEKNKILSSAVCGGLVIGGGICTLVYYTVDLYNILLLIAEGILTAFSYIIFANSACIFNTNKRRNIITQEETISICLCIGIFISGFSKIPLPFSLVSILTMYCVMSLSMLLPLGVSGSSAVALGLLCVQDSSGAFSVMGMLGLCSLISNMLKIFGKIGIIIGFTAGCGIIMLYNGNIPINPIEVVIASVLVLVTPKKFYSYINKLINRTQTNSDSVCTDRLREFIIESINSTSANFRHLSKLMTGFENKAKSGDVCDIFDDTASIVCNQCGMNVHCWRKEYNNTYKHMLDLFNILECKGCISEEDIPESFTERCIHPMEICSNMTHIYELYKQNAMWESQTDANRALVAQQYIDIAEIMDKLAHEAEYGFNFSVRDENYIEAELDKAGISTGKVNVLFKDDNDCEVFINSPYSNESEICRIVSSALGFPMHTDSNSEMMLHLSPTPRYSIKSAYLREAKYGCSEYGDTICEFSRNSGNHTFILSDGMGSGSEAKEQSELSCKLLREFISAGYSCQTSIDLLNSTLTLKSSKEIFSTVDLIDIDLKSGYASFFKAGASESFLMRDGVVNTIVCDSLPVGLLNISEISVEEINLERGDIIVMISDGIKGHNISDNSMITEILYHTAPDPEVIAERILAAALKDSNNMPADDMSVVVILVS